MAYGEVREALDKVNSQPGNIDQINMPTNCESCQIFARDFEAKAMEIPLKLVSSFQYSFILFQESGTAEGIFLDLYEGFCETMMRYKVHVDKQGLDRFQLDQSALLKNLQKMQKRGTEVSNNYMVPVFELLVGRNYVSVGSFFGGFMKNQSGFHSGVPGGARKITAASFARAKFEGGLIACVCMSGGRDKLD
jgi:hypothetical protein